MCLPLVVAGAAMASSFGASAALAAGTAATATGLAAGTAVATTSVFSSGAAWAAALAAGAAGASAGSEYEAAKFNEKLAGQQKESLENDAKNTRTAGSQESAQALQKSQKIGARNRVEYAAGGVDINQGTPLQVGEEVASVGALEQLTIIHNADRQALGLENEGWNLLESAKAAKKKAAMKVGTTLLTSAASPYMGAMSV